MNLLLVDNFDSFTYNLYQAFRIIGVSVTVFRNNSPELTASTVLEYDALVISPGPGNPERAGKSKELISTMQDTLPILGVCLGMQCINEVQGGKTVKAPVPVHGKTSIIHHQGTPLYNGIPSPFLAARYHSLIISGEADLSVTSQTDDGIPMSVTIPGKRVWGVQFHPESFLTPDGPGILRNFIELCSA